jgi:hypothetical protein
MRKIAFLFGLTLFLFACSNEGTNTAGAGHQHNLASEKKAKDTVKKSIPSEAIASVGNTDIRINYHAPAVRGRVIWGGLVPYDAVWVTGAHSATTMEIGKDFTVGDKKIPAGKYALFTIPGKDEWTIIINRNWNQHLADDYSETEDLVRIKVRPAINADMVERLKYEIEAAGPSAANIIISWEKMKVQFQVGIN